MDKPSLASCVAALRYTHPGYPQVGPTDEEADVAAAVEAIEAAHRGDADDPDAAGHWGRCTSCEAPWPCESWLWASHLAVQFVGRAADRVAAGTVLPPPDDAPENVTSLPFRRRPSFAWVSDAELMRRRYPPDGDVERWVREGSPGHINYPGTIGEPA